MATNNTRSLCPVCSTSYEPGTTIFCGQCGKRVVGVNDRTTIQLPFSTPTKLSPTLPATPLTPPAALTQPIETSPYSSTQQVLPPPATPLPVPSTRSRMTSGMLIVLFAIVFLGSSLFYAGYQFSRITPSLNTTSTTNRGGNSPNTTSTIVGTQTTTLGTTPTATAQATVKPSTTSENKLLSCSSCNGGDPILLTINKVTVSSTGMTWYTTFTNQSGDTQSFYVATFSLQDLSGGQHIDGTGDVLSKYDSYPYLGARQSDNGEIIFPFVPYIGVVYSLTAEIDGNSEKLSFDPITLTCTNSSCQFS